MIFSIFIQAVFPIRRFLTLWERIVFRAGAGIRLTKSEFVGNVTQVYLEDPAAFKKEIRAVYQDIIPLYDTNIDCLIEKDEFVHAFQDLGKNNVTADLEYFRFLRKPNGYPVAQMVDAWVQFHTNKKRSRKDIVTEPVKKLLKEN